MKKETVIIGITFLLMITCFATGCKKKEVIEEENVIQLLPTKEPIENQTEQPIETQEPLQEPTQEPIQEKEGTEDRKGKVKSKLTGLLVKEEIAKKRPYAIIFNNIKVANPQAGIEQADILYEAIVEGGITRLMGIFESFDSKKIGSIRSARHYFVSFADEYDAILVHFGQSTYGKKKIAALGIDNLNGLEQIGSTVFYRDNTIKAPHNAFASFQGIQKGTEKMKYREEYQEEKKNHYHFYKKDTDLKSKKKVKKVTFQFSSYTSPYFIYDETDKLYYRYQFGSKHIDKNTKNQLAFKNIIVQFVKQWTLDKKGYQSMDIENSSGTGYYISNGKMVDITWKKNESKKEMCYYNTEGKELTINPGKTYIAIFPNHHTEGVIIE